MRTLVNGSPACSAREIFNDFTGLTCGPDQSGSCERGLLNEIVAGGGARTHCVTMKLMGSNGCQLQANCAPRRRREANVSGTRRSIQKNNSRGCSILGVEGRARSRDASAWHSLRGACKIFFSESAEYGGST